MTIESCIEMRDIKITTQIGTYGPGEAIPEQDLLDLTLWVHSDLVLIAADEMKNVFDYEPLLKEIDRIAADGPYETQEWLVKRFIQACAGYSQIDALEIALRKAPIRAGGGSLGVRTSMSEEALAHLRTAMT